MSGATKQACFSYTVNRLSQRDRIFCLALSIAALLGVSRRGVFSFLKFPGMTVTVGISPNGFFRGFIPFLDLFGDFHLLKHSTSFVVSINTKIPSL